MITATIAERVARLPAGCRDALGLASAIGGDFDVATLAAVAAHYVPTTLGLLDDAVDAAIVEVRGLGRFAFRHPLFRAALYDHIGAGGRTAAHARIAVVLEAGPTVEPAVLAHHLAQSAPLGNAAAAARYAVAAGDAAMARLATRPRPGITDRHSTRPGRRRPCRGCGCGGPTPTPRRDATPARGPGTRRLPSSPPAVRRSWPTPRSAQRRRGYGGHPGRGVARAAGAGAHRGRRQQPRAAGPASHGSVVIAATAPPEQRAGLVAGRSRSPRRRRTRSPSPTPRGAATCTPVGRGRSTPRRRRHSDPPRHRLPSDAPGAARQAAAHRGPVRARPHRRGAACRR